MANIFLKVCAECARLNTVTAASCTCGYVFELQEAPPRVSAQDTAREERLYEEYLAARAQQAVEGARVAKHLAELFPQDRQKVMAAAELELAAQTAEAELAAQRARVAEIDSMESEITAAAGDSTASQAA